MIKESVPKHSQERLGDVKWNVINLETRLPEDPEVISQEEWEAEGEKLFGPDKIQWKFVCPNCGNVQCSEDFRKYKDVGATPSDAYFNCIGRFMGPDVGTLGDGKSPCDYSLGGLFILSKIVIRTPYGMQKVFDFYREDDDNAAVQERH